MSADLRGLLERAVVISVELADRADRDPISQLRWLPLQWAFLADPYPIKGIRAGNQSIGKSTAMFALLVGHCLGEHPLGDAGYVMPPPPVVWWLVIASKNAVDQQRKLWDLLPKHELDPRTEFDPHRGFTPVNAPAILFRNGSVIRLRTGNQDALDFASATLDGVAWDEPPAYPRKFVETVQRVEERGGYVLIAYTPINAPTDYLRELCERGTVHDHWSPLTPEALIPVGAVEPLRTRDGRPKDAAYIAEKRLLCPVHEQPVVIDGEWEMRSVERYFTLFREGGADSHVHARAPRHEVDLVVGIDHGSKPGKQIAVLMAVWRDRTDQPWRVYVVDEYTDTEGTATPAEDAAGVLAMLDRHRVRWGELTYAGGDRVHDPGTPQQKSNRDLSIQLVRQLERRGELPSGGELHPAIRTVKRGAGRGAGSAHYRSKWLYHRTANRGGFGVHPRCVRVISALRRYDLRDNEYKDPIDAVVYGLDPYIYGSVPRVAPELRLG